MNFYPKHIGDYKGATAHLSMIEDGAYNRMLDWYYAEERPLPSDKRQIYRLMRAQSKPEQRAIDAVLGEFFHASPDGFRHSRCDAEIARMQEKASKAKQSAALRWQSERIPPSNANASKTHALQHSDGNALHKPITNNQRKEKERESRGARPTPLGKKTAFPEGFTVSEAVRKWAEKSGFSDVDRHLEPFRNKCLAKGYSYVDWDRAFMEAVREDWAKLRPSQAAQPDYARLQREIEAEMAAAGDDDANG